jgi:hypothetical protein
VTASLERRQYLFTSEPEAGNTFPEMLC